MGGELRTEGLRETERVELGGFTLVSGHEAVDRTQLEKRDEIRKLSKFALTNKARVML